MDTKKIKYYVGNFGSINVVKSKDSEIFEASTSGGAVTSFLLYALQKKIVEEVLVVGMDKNKQWHYKIKILSSKKDVISCSGSKYVFIPIGEFLDKLKSTKKKIAVVGLPCQVSVFRKLQESGKFKNIKLIIGLFCGFNILPEATTFLLNKLGVNPNDVSKLKYRAGQYPGGFLVELKDGRRKSLPKHYYDFINLMFVPKGCLSCKDYTSEQADISVGDAWGFDKKAVVITRTDMGKKLLLDKSLDIEEITARQFIKMHHYNLKHKKKGDSFLFKLITNVLRVFGKYLPLRFLGFLAGIRRYFLKNV